MVQGCSRFAEIWQKFCGTPDFWEDVLNSFFLGFYIEIAYSNFTFYGTYMLSFLVRRTISAKRVNLRNRMCNIEMLRGHYVQGRLDPLEIF